MDIKSRFSLGALVLMFAGLAHAATFEAVGTVEEVQLGQSAVIVDQTTYALPNKTANNGTPVILQLKPGYLISFSGTQASPHPIIESVYIHPDSVRSVEEGEQP